MTCPSGKRWFARRRDAKRYMRRVQSHPECTVRRVYQCPLCMGWHMTSQPYQPPYGEMAVEGGDAA